MRTTTSCRAKKSALSFAPVVVVSTFPPRPTPRPPVAEPGVGLFLRGVFEGFFLEVDKQEFEAANDQLALALLLEWLMRHHRNMLVDYLDFLGVTHRQGETDEDFCATREPEKLREGVDALLKKYPAAHVATYVLLIGHLQETPVYDQTPAVLTALGMSAKEADDYVRDHQATYKPKAQRAPVPMVTTAAAS